MKCCKHSASFVALHCRYISFTPINKTLLTNTRKGVLSNHYLFLFALSNTKTHLLITLAMVLNKCPLRNPGKAPIHEPNANNGPSSPLSDPAPLTSSTTEMDSELDLFQKLIARTEKHNALVQKMNLLQRVK